MFSYRLCTVLGIPIRAHVTLAIFFPLMALVLSAQAGLHLLVTAFTLAAFFASIALHELGHAVVAMRYGCGVRQILLLPIGGVAQLSHIPSEPRQEVHIALAGPAVSIVLFALAGIAGTALAALGAGAAALVCRLISVMNLALGLFNLLPSFPMDGGRVFRALMTPRWGRRKATHVASRIGRALAVAFGVVGLLQFNLILIAIAIFIFHAAGAEYRRLLLKERFPQLDPERDDEVVVGPPPYARFRGLRSSQPLRRSKGIWDDVFHHWD
jgi:stage IV sporulation protein FB